MLWLTGIPIGLLLLGVFVPAIGNLCGTLIVLEAITITGVAITNLLKLGFEMEADSRDLARRCEAYLKAHNAGLRGKFVIHFSSD